MMKKLLILIVLALVGITGWRVYHKVPKTVTNQAAQAATISEQSAAKALSNFLPCASNNSGKTVVVSESRRHMWACDGKSQAADYPVVTGYTGFQETITPLGTYTISNKLLGIPLKGSDKLGSWNVFVQYWMPFLANQYGDYGFHDATWRQADEFGNTSDSSRQASHGCVEMPLAGMKWLYSWAPIGTKVSIVS